MFESGIPYQTPGWIDANDVDRAQFLTMVESSCTTCTEIWPGVVVFPTSSVIVPRLACYCWSAGMIERSETMSLTGMARLVATAPASFLGSLLPGCRVYR